MSANSVVRLATEADRVEVWRLFLQAHKENGMFELATDKVDWMLGRLLNPDKMDMQDGGPFGVIGVIGPVGALEGLCILLLGCFWYTKKRHIEELMVFVDPECRKSNHAKSLIEWMKQQSEESKLKLLSGIISNTRTEAKCRLYRRSGLPKAGEFFLYSPTE
jgi:GNAT superfamily N-acetyltransferase